MRCRSMHYISAVVLRLLSGLLCVLGGWIVPLCLGPQKRRRELHQEFPVPETASWIGL